MEASAMSDRKQISFSVNFNVDVVQVIMWAIVIALVLLT
jgi:hypothetical protein